MINSPERPYLKWLASGEKTAEGRCNTKKYRSMSIGDFITMKSTSTDEYIKGKIVFKHEYDSFRAMLETEGVKNMLPFLHDDEIEVGIAVYEAFPGSERVEEYGCVAIGLHITTYNLIQ